MPADRIRSAEEFAQGIHTPLHRGEVAEDLRARDREIIEACCRAMCRLCGDAIPTGGFGDQWRHGQAWCPASPIRTALAHLLSEDEA